MKFFNKIMIGDLNKVALTKNKSQYTEIYFRDLSDTTYKTRKKYHECYIVNCV